MTVLAFGPFALDPVSRALTREGTRVPLTDRQFEVLWHLASHAGTIVSKDALIDAAWSGVAVTDNSLEQAISVLRKALGERGASDPSIQTVPRQGYRFAAVVRSETRRASDEDLEELLAPHRAWLEGRAALESLTSDRVAAALAAFSRAVALAPGHAPAHVGLANAGTLRFESTRADLQPDLAALATALTHAREACRLDPAYAEAWATLALAEYRGGDPLQALAAARRAVTLEPDSWKHHLRLAFVSWGDERLRAATRTRALLPGLALAHWLAATVHIARGAFDAAERELVAGCAAQDRQHENAGRFGAVGLHWLRGLVHLARNEPAAAAAAFARELTFEASGHLYARESSASAWYGLAAVHLRAGDTAAAADALAEAQRRLPGHPLSLAALAALTTGGERDRLAGALSQRLIALRAHHAGLEAALADAVFAVLDRRSDHACALLQHALAATERTGPMWIVPVEPMLHADAASPEWAGVLAAIRARAA